MPSFDDIRHSREANEAYSDENLRRLAEQVEAAPPVPQEAAPRAHDFWCDLPKCLGPCNCHRAIAPDWAMRVARQISALVLFGHWEDEENKTEQMAALIREAGSERERRLITSLQTHWLAQIECNHYEHNDSAICACGWKSDRGFNVGKAVEFWIDHVWAEASRLLGGESK